jgi:acetylornithine deacetylase
MAAAEIDAERLAPVTHRGHRARMADQRDRTADAYLYDITRRLIAIDTVSAGSNAAAAALVAEELEALGFQVAVQEWNDADVLKRNVVASIGPAVPDGLLVSGHLDTVPFTDQSGWTRDPLTLEAADDRLYGRGTSDMKGFIAAAIAAAARLEGARLVRPLVLAFTADEEIGCLGARRLVPELPALLGTVPVPRLAWIGEPSGFRIHRAHKGIVGFRIEVQGVGGHSSVPSLGVNAVTVMGRIIDVIARIEEELVAGPHPDGAALFGECPHPALNLGRVRGGTALNMIPDRCTLDVSYRPLPADDPFALHRTIAARIAAAAPRDPQTARPPRIEVGEPRLTRALESPPGTALEAALIDGCGAIPAAGAPFATDGGELAQVGIASLICGPGDLEQAHQPDESIGRVALERARDGIVAVVTRLCGA